MALKHENRIVLTDSQGNVVAAADERTSGQGHVPGGMGMMGMMGGTRTPIVVEDKTVGTVAFTAPTRSSSRAVLETGFISGVNQSLLISGLLSVLVAVILGAGMAQHLTRPLKELTVASQRIAAGHLDQRVEVSGSKEVKDLAGAFNSMAANLARAEELRRNLVTDVAHELRTPITSMQVHLEGALDGAVEVNREMIELLHGETLHLGELVNELRDLSAAEAGRLKLNLEAVDLGDVARREAKVLGPRFAQANVTLDVDVAGEVPTVQADIRRLVQVLRNLLENALAHSNAGGVVTLRVSPTDEGVEVSVADTGSGIAAEDLPYVFERFYRGGEAGGGSGIGLTITKRLVEAHGGSMDVSSVPGEGTTMIARLPSASS
jgi:signal transduction histidine kinase